MKTQNYQHHVHEIFGFFFEASYINKAASTRNA